MLVPMFVILQPFETKGLCPSSRMSQLYFGVKCEDETHTPKSGNLESSGIPENSELEFRGQNTLH
jgi:hypothetical protein